LDNPDPAVAITAQTVVSTSRLDSQSLPNKDIIPQLQINNQAEQLMKNYPRKNTTVPSPVNSSVGADLAVPGSVSFSTISNIIFQGMCQFSWQYVVWGIVISRCFNNMNNPEKMPDPGRKLLSGKPTTIFKQGS
jgi:hypothetical protein